MRKGSANGQVAELESRVESMGSRKMSFYSFCT